MAYNLLPELTAHFRARELHPSPAWLHTCLSSLRPNTPLPALRQTVHFRLLATDITTSLSPPPTNIFPSDILNARIQSRFLAGPLVVQILDIEDIGHSRWSQVESIEAKERGETTKGREIVRVVSGEDDSTPTPAPGVESKGPFKLLLQDPKGAKVYALDLRGTEGLNTNMNMGAKLLLRNCDVRRAVVILEPGCVQILGGKIEALDKAWKAAKKERLMASARGSREVDGG